jgi:hypothetical protein
MTEIATYFAIMILNDNSLNSIINRQRLAHWTEKQDPAICCSKEMYFTDKDKHRFK